MKFLERHDHHEVEQVRREQQTPRGVVECAEDEVVVLTRRRAIPKRGRVRVGSRAAHIANCHRIAH